MNRTFFKTQMELSTALMSHIDAYYAGTKSEAETVEVLRGLADKNEDLMFASGDYGAIVIHRLGKKRMRVLRGAIEQESNE